MDSLKLECVLLSAGGQKRGKAAALALGGGGTVVGARGGGGDCVDHETAVFAGGPGCLGACVEAFVSLNLYGIHSSANSQDSTLEEALS